VVAHRLFMPVWLAHVVEQGVELNEAEDIYNIIMPSSMQHAEGSPGADGEGGNGGGGGRT
jgi:hypothetical protein